MLDFQNISIQRKGKKVLDDFSLKPQGWSDTQPYWVRIKRESPRCLRLLLVGKSRKQETFI